MTEIIPYTDLYADEFKAINVEWLDAFNLMESHDLHILDHPKETILDTGGVIYLARLGNEIIGSAALINEGHGIFELAKMTVRPEHRGMGISKLLLTKCLDTARQLQAKKIILFSNSRLKTAIALYEQYGFKHTTVTDAPFLTADIKMELSL